MVSDTSRRWAERGTWREGGRGELRRVELWARGVAFGPGSNHVHPAERERDEREFLEREREKCTRLLGLGKEGRLQEGSHGWRVGNSGAGRPAWVSRCQEQDEAPGC